MLEKAFIESYRKLCDNNNDVIDEFIKRVDKVLSEDSVESKLEKAKNTDTNLRSKRSILLEKYLDGSVAQDVYEAKDLELARKLATNEAAIESLKNSVNKEKVYRIRLKEFRRVLEENRYLEKFDRDVFENLIEKVILLSLIENNLIMFCLARKTNLEYDGIDIEVIPIWKWLLMADL